MGCGCGQKINQNTGVKAQQMDRVPRSIPVSKSVSTVSRTCPLCKHPLRYLHSYDTSTRNIVKKFICSNPSCANK
jgi:hypothetical protein